MFLKANKKTVKIFVYNFFLYIKMLTGYYKKKAFKEACQRYQNLSKEEKDEKPICSWAY